VREGLNRLQLPWFAIVGDHDVHPKRHHNFLHFMMPEPFYRFEIGSYRFFALDAFASDDPKVFDISSEQLKWLQQELELARVIHKRCVLFLHCYPSELGTSSSALRDLIKRYGVLLERRPDRSEFTWSVSATMPMAFLELWRVGSR